MAILRLGGAHFGRTGILSLHHGVSQVGLNGLGVAGFVEAVGVPILTSLVLRVFMHCFDYIITSVWVLVPAAFLMSRARPSIISSM